MNAIEFNKTVECFHYKIYFKFSNLYYNCVSELFSVGSFRVLQAECEGLSEWNCPKKHQNGSILQKYQKLQGWNEELWPNTPLTSCWAKCIWCELNIHVTCYLVVTVFHFELFSLLLDDDVDMEVNNTVNCKNNMTMVHGCCVWLRTSRTRNEVAPGSSWVHKKCTLFLSLVCSLCTQCCFQFK